MVLGKVLVMNNRGLEARLGPPRAKRNIKVLISRGGREGGLPPLVADILWGKSYGLGQGAGNG